MPGPKYTGEQQRQFFDLLDRGGTVRSAALASGVDADAAYTWLRDAGLTMRRRTPRIYTDAERAEFLRLLGQLHNVKAAAAALGSPAVTCYSWAHKAGIFTSKTRQVSPRKQEFLRLREQGLTRGDAARQVGADKRSAADWDKGIAIMLRGRVHPDGRTVRYPPGPGSGVVTSSRTVGVLGGQVDLTAVEAVIHPRYLSLVEREHLRDLRRSGLSIRAIGLGMGRSPSTVSRELRRNLLDQGVPAARCAPGVGGPASASEAGEAACAPAAGPVRPDLVVQEVVAAADQPSAAQGLPGLSRDARLHRDDLPGDLRPRSRSAATRPAAAIATWPEPPPAPSSP